MKGWGAHNYGGLPDYEYLDPFKPQAQYQQFGTESCNFGPPSLGYSATGPPSYGQHYGSVLLQQIGRDPFPRPVTFSSGSVPMD